MTKNEAKRAFLDRGILKKDAFDRFLNEDPTTQKKYVFYMIKEYLRQADNEGNKVSDLSLDDLDMGILSPIFSYVTEYNALLGRVPQNKKDIYKLPFDELVDIVDTLNNAEGESERSSLRKRARENSYNFNEMGIVDVPGVSVVAPMNHDAICYYGQGTRWCVAMDTPTHWVGYFFNSRNTFFIISATSDAVKKKIRDHYKDKWREMGLGRVPLKGKKMKWVLVKNDKDVDEVAAENENEAAELFKQRLGLDSLKGYTVENYGYRNLYKVAFLIPPMKNRSGEEIKDENGEYISDWKRAHIYSSDDISFNNGWREYFKVIGLDKFIEE